MRGGERRVGADEVEVSAVVPLSAVLDEELARRHPAAGVLSPVSIYPARLPDASGLSFHSEQHVELHEAVEAARPFPYVAAEETEAAAQAAAAASGVVVGPVYECLAVQIGQTLARGAKSV